MNRQAHPASFRDRSGFIFIDGGRIFRQINQSYKDPYEYSQRSGLYAELVDAGLLISHREVDHPPADDKQAYKVIQPETIDFISYPYEWSFSQLKDAALATLKIQRVALENGMSLKDASAYNIQFHRGQPVLMDSLSFSLLDPGSPWVAYRQFCQHFLAPLALMALVDIRLQKLLQTNLDGIPLDLAGRLLPRRSMLNFGLLTHIHLHAASQRAYAGARKKDQPARRSMNMQAHQGLIQSLLNCIQKLRWDPTGVGWTDYYQASIRYEGQALDHKKQIIQAWVERVEPHSVWDLGANTGVFSRIASRRNIPTVSFDLDPGAVEVNYLASREENEANLLPLVIDLANPSPSIGWDNAERDSLLQRGPADMVFALALIHHLAIGNNVPLPSLASFFSSTCRWLAVEFVPKDDEQVERLLSFREDIFTDYTQDAFERTFKEFFEIRDVEAIQQSKRTLYLMQRK